MSRKFCLNALIAAFIISLTGYAAAEVNKDEVVYALLSPAGEVHAVYLVNAFESDVPVSVLDYGVYDAVLPLADAEGFVYRDGQARFTMQPGRFVYQGTMPEEILPWRITLDYTLDGQPVLPEDLPGVSGLLQGRLRVVPEEHLRGFADSLTLQVTLTLDSENSLGIQADLAAQAVAGGNRALSYVILPGQSADYTFSARVLDFSMPGFQAIGIRIPLDTKMYQNIAAEAVSGTPMETVVGSLMGNFISRLGGSPAASFADSRNAIRSLQFVLMGEGIRAEKPDVIPAVETLPETFLERFLDLFGL
jgi:hypothetical protein